MSALCVGCGYCCLKATCTLGQTLFGLACPCGGLFWSIKENRFYCRAVLESSQCECISVKEELAIGAGCCGSLFNTQRDACIAGGLQDYLMEIDVKCSQDQRLFKNWEPK